MALESWKNQFYVAIENQNGFVLGDAKRLAMCWFEMTVALYWWLLEVGIGRDRLRTMGAIGIVNPVSAANIPLINNTSYRQHLHPLLRCTWF
jgi:hypothetical protein